MSNEKGVVKIIIYLIVFTAFCIDAWVCENKLNLVVSSIGIGASLRSIWLLYFGSEK